MINFNNKKTQRIISAVIVSVLVLSLVVGLLVSAL